MDELTIADQKYLSSKKAAQVTGYAKDYVGQLCREGRVDARLVGRNWYVLESSILEHRFGAEEVKASPVLPKEPYENVWKSPIYKAEPVQELPQFVSIPEKAPVEETSLPEVTPLASQKVLTDMQLAWQEWFASQEKAEKLLPDGSDMLLNDGEEDSSQAGIDEIPNTVEAAPAGSNESVHVSRYHQEELPELITGRSRHEEAQTIRIQVQKNDLPSYAEVRPYRETGQRPMPSFKRSAPKNKRNVGSPIIVQALILSITGLIVATTIIASGFTEDFISGSKISNPLTNFLSGISSIR